MFNKEKDIFNILFEAVSEGVLVVDDQQNIVSVNSSIEKIFGYKKEELIGQQLQVLIPIKHHVAHNAYFKGFVEVNESKQMGQGLDLFGLRKGGDVFPLEVGLNPFKIYGKTFIMALVIDISKRRRQEIEVQNLNLELEKKVKQRTSDLSKKVKELNLVNIELGRENKKRITAENQIKDALKKEKELNGLKTKFLSLVSHEFKTPLSVILTSNMLLGKYKLTEQQENRNKHLAIITDRIKYLNHILDDFLSVEKMDSGKYNYSFHNFKIIKVVNEVIYNANMLLKEGQKINYPEDIDEISIFQDEKIIELALSNLISNAIKYSPEDTQIKIVIKQEKNSTFFVVKDNGIGIPVIDQKNVFNRYFRAENAVLTQGTGIGLNIVKSHLINLGGNISFESVENKGSIFTMKIPNKARQ
jgi:hypothetical protein